MSFLSPGRLWLLLLVPVLIGGYALLQVRRRHYALRFTNVALIDTVVPRRPQWRQHVAVGLAMLTLAGIIFCFARPAEVQTVEIRVDKPQLVVITIDCSLSMDAADVPPDRFAAAKAAAKNFLNDLPPRYQVALVSFARGATVRVAPTTDRAKVSTAIDALTTETYTAIGEGIYAALGVAKVASSPAVIVLLGDGKSTVGRSALGAARDAKKAKVPIYTVALGTLNGVIVNQGRDVPVPVDTEQLKEIAKLSGGSTYDASSSKDLKRAYGDVKQQITTTTMKKDVTAHYLGFVLVLALLSTASGVFVASRLT